MVVHVMVRLSSQNAAALNMEGWGKGESAKLNNFIFYFSHGYYDLSRQNLKSDCPLWIGSSQNCKIDWFFNLTVSDR